MNDGGGKIGDGVGEEEQEGKRSGEEGVLDDAYKEEVEEKRGVSKVEEKRGAGRKGSLGLSMAIKTLAKDMSVEV